MRYKVGICGEKNNEEVFIQEKENKQYLIYFTPAQAIELISMLNRALIWLREEEYPIWEMKT